MNIWNSHANTSLTYLRRISTLLGIVFFVLSSCVDQPEFSVIPAISYKSIEFIETAEITDPDSLIVYINFKDGDGNIGLTSIETDSPFHQANFFLGSNGQLRPVSSTLVFNFEGYKFGSSGATPKNPSFLLGHLPVSSGKLVSFSSKSDPAYSFLPPYQAPYTCLINLQAYLDDTLFVDRAYRYALNPATIVDSLISPGNTVTHYAVLDQWYVEPNENHYNIAVQFLVKNADGSFTEFDWRREFCTTFDGRFPVLVDKTRPLEGTLSYAMTSTGFMTLFSQKTLKLRIQIKDRTLNKSNIIETEEFTLDKI